MVGKAASNFIVGVVFYGTLGLTLYISATFGVPFFASLFTVLCIGALGTVAIIVWRTEGHAIGAPSLWKWLVAKEARFSEFTWCWFLGTAITCAFFYALSFISLPNDVAFLVGAICVMALTFILTTIMQIALVARLLTEYAPGPRVEQFVAFWRAQDPMVFTPDWPVIVDFGVAAILSVALAWLTHTWWSFFPYLLATSALIGTLIGGCREVAVAGWNLGEPVRLPKATNPELPSATHADSEELERKGIAHEE
ncbi:MAG: hypothetical protein NTV56_00800 [Alphaproteobacteria bacterium]|nr:hypothetical protein [Alphaproteobacteria bacterium]